MINITNDTSTLNGSLVEMKDQLLTELSNKGVTTSFDPTTGLLGLISEISNIPTGGGATVDTLTLTTNKTILSYADSETATLTITAYDSNNNPVPNAQIGLYKNNTYWDTITTNNNGVATKTYNSTGTGDITITAVSSIALYKTITIEDCYKYINTGSHTFGSSIMTFYELFDANGIGDCEISVKLKSANQKGFSLDYRKSNTDTNNTSLERVGVDSLNDLFVTALNSGGSGTPSTSTEYSTNTDLLCKIHRENGATTLTVGTNSYNYTSIADLRYIGIMNWNNAKTVTYTDFIVKPL